MNKFLTGLSISILLFAIAAFSLSYNNLQAVAKTHGYTGWQSILWPLIIDAVIVLLTIVLLYYQIKKFGNAAIVFVWLGVAVYTSMSVYSSYQASDYTLPGIFVKVIPVVSLLVLTEVLRHTAKVEIERNTTMKSTRELLIENKRTLTAWEQSQKQLADVMAAYDREKEKLEAVQSQVTEVQKANDGRTKQKRENMSEFLDHLLNNPSISISKAAKDKKISRTTAGNYVRELQETEGLYKNGNGWEVKQ